ncbi:Pycsar system effector family protein [Altererythrobacter lauratis]|uniref:Pycsar system effector family protein n=1 Tax=Alteraurantiacibacter lauratis TaxID=2054627 RepID=A0ABV7EIT6_9SPHN
MEQRNEGMAEAMRAATYSAQAVQMLRTVQVNSLALSQMADQKASILMGATFLVFSITVSRALSGEVPWSLVILAVSAFLSSLLAVAAVIPSVGRPPARVKPNLMFFGHFADLDEEQWMREVLAQLHSDEDVFRVMLHDIYQNGQVLQRRKYRYLALAYRSFIFGLVLTLMGFAVEMAAS